jgi:hypothetical protein
MRITSRPKERLVMTDCERTAENRAVHFRAGAEGKRRGFEIMRDIYIAIRADRFFGSGVTNVAAMSRCCATGRIIPARSSAISIRRRSICASVCICPATSSLI